MRLRGIKSEFYENLSEREKDIIRNGIMLLIIAILVICVALDIAFT